MPWSRFGGAVGPFEIRMHSRDTVPEMDLVTMAHCKVCSPRSWQDRMCVPFLRALPISGVSIWVLGAGRVGSTVCSSDDTAARLDAVHFDCGEGPRWEVVRTGRAVMVSNIRARSHDRWPFFSSEASRLGVGALFAFPIRLGAVVVGVADMYRRGAGDFDSDQAQQAQDLASAAAAEAVQHATFAADHERPLADVIEPEMRREVLQATGMILVQLETTAHEALVRLKAHAFARGDSVLHVANLVVLRQLDFRDVE